MKNATSNTPQQTSMQQLAASMDLAAAASVKAIVPHYQQWCSPSPVARRLLLHVFSISEVRCDRPVRIYAFNKPGVSIAYVKSGRGRVRLGKTEWLMESNGCFWIMSNDLPRLYVPFPGETFTVRAFRFGGQGLESWIEELDSRRRPQFRLQHPQLVIDAFHRLLALGKKTTPASECQIHHVLTSVLTEFLLSHNLLASNRIALLPYITTTLNAVEADPTRNWKVTHLARIGKVSGTAFRKAFSRSMKESPHAYLAQVRLDAAREMLSDPRLLSKEIAARLHFSSNHYFSSFFRKHTGMSPTQFRQTLK